MNREEALKIAHNLIIAAHYMSDNETRQRELVEFKKYLEENLK